MKLVSRIIGILWFLGCGLWVFLMIPFTLLCMLFLDIRPMVETGFSGQIAGFTLFGILALLLSLTCWVKPFRWCFLKFPWLYAFSAILMADVLLLAGAEEILSHFLSDLTTIQYILGVGLMTVELILGRLLMCWYFHKHPLVSGKEG